MKLFWKMISILIIFLMLNCISIYVFNPGNSYNNNNNKVVVTMEELENRGMGLLNTNNLNPGAAYMNFNSLIKDNETLDEINVLNYITNKIDINKNISINVMYIAKSYQKLEIPEIPLYLQPGYDIQFVTDMKLSEYRLMNLFQDIGREINSRGEYVGINLDEEINIVCPENSHTPGRHYTITLRDFFTKCVGWKFDGDYDIIFTDGTRMTPIELYQIETKKLHGEEPGVFDATGPRVMRFNFVDVDNVRIGIRLGVFPRNGNPTRLVDLAFTDWIENMGSPNGGGDPLPATPVEEGDVGIITNPIPDEGAPIPKPNGPNNVINDVIEVDPMLGLGYLSRQLTSPESEQTIPVPSETSKKGHSVYYFENILEFEDRVEYVELRLAQARAHYLNNPIPVKPGEEPPLDPFYNLNRRGGPMDYDYSTINKGRLISNWGGLIGEAFIAIAIIVVTLVCYFKSNKW